MKKIKNNGSALGNTDLKKHVSELHAVFVNADEVLCASLLSAPFHDVGIRAKVDMMDLMADMALQKPDDVIDDDIMTIIMDRNELAIQFDRARRINDRGAHLLEKAVQKLDDLLPGDDINHRKLKSAMVPHIEKFVPRQLSLFGNFKPTFAF